MIYLIVIPMLLAVLLIPFVSGKKSFLISSVAAAISLALSSFFFFEYFNRPAIESVTWFTSGSIKFTLSMSASNLTLFMAILVSFISLLVLVFSNFYMRDEPQRRYYSEMSLFIFSMLGLVLSNSLLLFYVFWELVGVTSYLLIGFWYGREAPASAGKKALLLTRIGDIAFFAALVVLFVTLRTFSISTILADVSAIGPATLSIVASLLFIAVISKSAQFPFYTWLVDAMEGPTPVSALLHSATMVAAGAFLLVLMLPLFIEAGFGIVILSFGFFTAFLAALLALKEVHLKRILAYSTIESLSFMFIAAATANAGGAIFYLFTHAIFKSLLFFIAGALMVLFGSYDIYKLKSSKKNKGWLFVPAIIGFSSIAGLPPFMSFFAHLGVSANFTLADSLIFLLLSFLTALFSFRALFVAFGKGSGPRPIKNMYAYIPIIILSAISILGGVLLFYFSGVILINYSFDAFSVISVIASLLGVYVAFELFSRSRLPSAVSRSKAASVNLSKYGWDKIITAFGGSFMLFAVWIGRVDDAFIRLFSRLGEGFISLASASRAIENGDATAYVAAVLLGLVIIIAVAVVFV